MEEGSVGGEEMRMSGRQSAELAEPCVGAFDDPATLVSSQLASIFVLSQLAVLPIGHDPFDAAFAQPLAEWVGAVGTVGGHALRPLPRTTLGAGDFDLGERGLRKLRCGGSRGCSDSDLIG